MLEVPDPALPPPLLSLLGLLELAMEKTPESAWLAGESLFEASRGDSKHGINDANIKDDRANGSNQSLTFSLDVCAGFHPAG